MEDNINEIKSRLNIVEVIQSYLKLQKTGANFRAICPFHSEKKPSFFVSPARQIWHCFGCSAGGGLFDFVMKIEGVEFGDALRILAQKAGVELKRERPELRSERQRLYEICELATKFFERQLESNKIGQEARKYLLGRGITEESIKKWRLGYAPDAWQGLSDFLVGRGYKREEIIKAGLAIKKESTPESSQDTYDRFRGRIIFPIFDLNSQTIGFGGRVFGPKSAEEIAKYVNTPNTLLYDKSRVLYGLDKAKVEIRKRDNCILVEGYTDVILAHQVGFENTVATSGTALTPYQLRILKRYSENLLTAFDMDIAGDSATKRGIDLAQSQGFSIKVITMPPGLDPADIIAKDPKSWGKLTQEAKSIFDFYFETTFSRFDRKTADGKKEISKILLPLIKRIPNKILQAHWIQDLAKKLEVKEEDIETELKKITRESSASDFFEDTPALTNSLKRAMSRKELLEERTLALILGSKQNLELFTEENLSFFSPQISQLISHFQKNGFEAKIELSPEQNNLLNYLFLRAEVEAPEVNIEEELKNCLREIRVLEIKDKLDKISQEIKKAEEEKDSEKSEKLIQEFHNLTKEMVNEQ